MTHASLFSGIGGFDLAAQWMGWENVLHCELNPFCRKILNYYWPDAISYEDIKKTDFSIHGGTIDILTGGFPCQPYSTAGKRLGKADDRHLWPEMLRAIREIQPAFVVGENVRGLISWNGGMVFDEVQADLEVIGYEVTPFILPACAVDAPHRRDRVWFIANAIRGRCGAYGQFRSVGGIQGDRKNYPMSSSESNPLPAPDAKSNGDRGGLFGMEEKNGKIRQPKEHRKNYRKPWHNGKERDVAYPTSFGSRETDGIRESGFFYEAFEKPNWQNFPTQPPICGGDDGLPTRLDGITFPKWRNESIKGYGNAIVPQVAYEIFKVIDKMLTL